MNAIRISRITLTTIILCALYLPVQAADVPEIFKAAFSGDGQAIERLLKAGAAPDERGSNGATVLIVAAHNGHDHIVRALIDAGADVNARMKIGRTALHQAAQGGYMNVVATLIAHGANVDAKDVDGYTPLIVAARKHNRIVRVLIDAGADVNAGTKKGRTALHQSAQNRNNSVVATLIAHGAIVDTKNLDGHTPLMFASFAGDDHIVRVLINAGADINATSKRGRAALHLASENGNNDVVTTLIANGANVDAKDVDGYTPLIVAAIGSGDNVTVNTLISNRADIEARTVDSATPLIAAALQNNGEAFYALLKQGADINATTKQGSTPLRIATSKSNRDFIEELLRRGADANIPDASGDTALDEATVNRDGTIRLLLLNAGARAKRTGLEFGTEYIIGKPEDLTAASLTVNTKEGTRSFLVGPKTLLCADGKETKDLKKISIAKTITVFVGMNERTARKIYNQGTTMRIKDSKLVAEGPLECTRNPSKEALLNRGANPSVEAKSNAAIGSQYKILIAVPDFVISQSNLEEEGVASQGALLLRNRLDSSGYINTIVSQRVNQLKRLDLGEDTSLYEKWKELGVQALIKGEYSATKDRINIKLMLFDVSNNKLVIGKRYSGRPSHLGRIMHKFADKVVYHLTGKEVAQARISEGHNNKSEEPSKHKKAPEKITNILNQEVEPLLLKGSGNMATIYRGKLVAFNEPIVTVHGKFILGESRLQAIKCKLSSRKTRGIRYFDGGALEQAVFAGGPTPDPTIIDKIKHWVGRNVKVGPLDEDCVYFELVGDK
jgi:ankyrin repeat protein